MAVRPLPAATDETREQRIEAILKELRPKVEATVRQVVGRALYVSGGNLRDGFWSQPHRPAA